jgi:catechol 2,3-dioxygenase-like lactoylglutathione lyase family enzyme
MSVDRIVTNLISPSPKRTQQFYAVVLGLRPVMDHGWIVTLADPEHPQAQLSLVSSDATAPVVPEVSIQVDDVDRAYELAQQAGAEIVHPLTDEPWGVRRFFVRDPDGHVVNVLSHP